MMFADTLMTRAEVAEWLQVTRHYLDAIGARNEGPPFVRLGRRAIRYDRAQVAEWLQRQSLPAAAA